MKLLILEGPRGSGKSSIAFQIRQKVKGVTLTNFTGFNLDYEDGLESISSYYNNWVSFLKTMKNHDSIFVCDRFFFSEMVFSKLYKHYDFTDEYMKLIHTLEDLADEVKIVFMKVNNKDEISNRLLRDKIEFANKKDTYKESFKQQEEYERLFKDLKTFFSKEDCNIDIIEVDTTGKSLEEVETEVFSVLQVEMKGD